MGYPRLRRSSRPARLLGILAAGSLLAVLSGGAGAAPPVTLLTQDDFRHGTYVIDQPGRYRLAEDIRFDPNSVATLNRLCRDAPEELPASARCPLDAWRAGFPFPTQFTRGGGAPFRPGGPLDARYDPKGFGLGFFAAIVITADGVDLDLGGHRIEQSEQHALLQRFFAVIELAEQPFVPSQGPADFGEELEAARNVVIRNGTIGRSAHHGIHGNGNRNVRIRNVDFEDYEVAAVALNGVDGLLIRGVHASNRKDVPVLGTFSAAQFIKPYLEFLVRSGAPTTFRGRSPREIRDALRDAVLAVHEDLVVDRHLVGGRPRIDAAEHPAEAALFDNPRGLVDGNSYSFLVNELGVAVNGFPRGPTEPSRNVVLQDVHVDGQHGFVNEIVTLARDGTAVTDPVGAVLQLLNRDAEGRPVTLDEAERYRGNAVADAQLLVAKAAANGDFAGSHLDLTRLSITQEVVAWAESDAPLSTLADGPGDWLCNGDSMFHVNKGVIGFKMDAARNVVLANTTVRDLVNHGREGSERCGDYSGARSHPLATLPGYGGARTRAYSFAGSRNVFVRRARAEGVRAAAGDATGLDVFTDSRRVFLLQSFVEDLEAGLQGPPHYAAPNGDPAATGFRIGPAVERARLLRVCAELVTAFGEERLLDDLGGDAFVRAFCRGRRP